MYKTIERVDCILPSVILAISHAPDGPEFSCTLSDWHLIDNEAARRGFQGEHHMHDWLHDLGTTKNPDLTCAEPRRILSLKLEDIVRRIDTELALEDGQGFAQEIIASVVKDLRGGDFSLIFGGYEFDDPAAAQAALLRIFPQGEGREA